MRADELRAKADSATIAETLIALGNRHKARQNETVRSLVTRAAATGDKEAEFVLASGVLDRPAPKQKGGPKPAP